MAILHHWNYFLAIEEDVVRLSRFVEFSTDNFNTYSTEMTRILMAATQETDVLLHAICAHRGNDSDSEAKYRSFVRRRFPHFVNHKVALAQWELVLTPFEAWSSNGTPVWWTANNKVKHQRGSHFAKGSLENMLNACSALFLTLIYYYDAIGLLHEVWPSAKLFLCPDIGGVTRNTALGHVFVYRNIDEDLNAT